MQQRIKLAAFDLDGTIADTIPDLALAAEQSVRMHCQTGSVSVELAKRCIGNGLAVYLKRIYDHMRIVTDDFERELLDMKSFYFKNCTQNTRLYEGTTAVLERAAEKGVITAVVTMKPYAPAKKILEKLGVFKYFSALIAGDTMAAPKPDAWCVEELVRMFSVEPKNILVIGDGMTDVGMAKNAGAMCAAALYGYGDRNALVEGKADFYINSIEELNDII